MAESSVKRTTAELHALIALATELGFLDDLAVWQAELAENERVEGEKTYHFAWQGRNKFIDATSEDEARVMFAERFGFEASFVSATVKVLD
jgi:hypothetical protein